MSEPDKKHEVRTVFTLVDEVSEKSNKMAENLEKAHAASENLAGRLERFAGSGLALVGLGLGAGELAHKLYEVSEAAETVKSRIAAANIQSGRFTKLGPMREFAIAQERAASNYEKIEEMATKGVTSTQNYATIFETILAPSLEHTKASQQEVLELTEALVPSLMAATGSFEGAQMQAQMLGGALRGMQFRPPKELLAATHLNIKQWKQLEKKGPATLFKEVKKRVEESSGPMSKLFSGPGLAMMRIRNLVDQTFHKLGEPVMAEVGKEAEKLATWMVKNKDAVREMGEKLAGNVVRGIHLAVQGAEVLAKHWKLILGGMAAIRMAPAAISAAGTALKGISWLTRGATVTGGGIPVHVTNFPNGGSSGGGEGILRKAGKWALAGVGGAGAAVLGTMAVGFGALYYISKEKSALVDRLIAETNRIESGGATPEEMERIAGAWRDIAAEKNKALGIVVRHGGMQMVEDPNAVVVNGRMVSMRHGKMSMHLTKKQAEAQAALDKTGEYTKGWKPPPAQNNFDFRGSRFDIKQAFAEGFDPDRIAVAFTDDLASYGERRVQSNFAPLFSVR